jgi:hypothetical protein
MSAAELLCEELTKSGIAIDDWWRHAKLAEHGQTLDERFKRADEDYVERMQKRFAAELAEEERIEAERRRETALAAGVSSNGDSTAAGEPSEELLPERPAPPFEARLEALLHFGVQVRRGFQGRVPRLRATREELQAEPDDEDDGLSAGDDLEANDSYGAISAEEIPGIDDDDD